MPGRTFTTSDLSRRSGDIIAEALQHPVTLTQRNKPRLVVLNIEQYEEMRKQADRRRAVMIEQLPDFITKEEMQAALDAYLKEGDD